jgi:hypothetical protein
MKLPVTIAFAVLVLATLTSRADRFVSGIIRSGGLGASVPNPPIMSGVSASVLNASNAVVVWATSRATTNNVVDYGPTTAYGTSLTNAALGTSHTNTLLSLSASTTYHFRARSQDGSFGYGSDNTFTTPNAYQLVFLVAGQSLSVGQFGSPLQAVDTQPEAFNNYTLQGSTTIEANYANSWYIGQRQSALENGTVTGWRSCMDQISYMSRSAGFGSQNDALLLNNAQGGVGIAIWGSPTSATTATYSPIDGASFITNRFNAIWSMVQTQAVFQPSLNGTPILVGGIFSVGGESDNTSPTYGQQAAYYGLAMYTNVQTIGQTAYIPMLSSEYASADGVQGGPGNSNMLSVAEQSGGSTNILALSKYFLTSLEGTHLTNFAYRVMGEYYGKAWFIWKTNGSYQPVEPISLARSGATITLTYTNSGTGRWPLVFDTNVVTNPGNYGFEALTNGVTIPILSVSIPQSGQTNTVVITLTNNPNQTVLVRYASQAFGYGVAGPTTGPRGCLRDSDPTIGYTSGSNLWNWAAIIPGKYTTP